ncbi:hypothetical protein [Spirosoma panaciterrae]|uniref:hypothetical protein n=1 Tax=Spirosoma panaciterrae TaxID=496058 RepID=UPI0003702224|nr:hypothetical protein [Spirosoma panaciterrae]
MKFLSLAFLISLFGAGVWYVRSRVPEPVAGVQLIGNLPPQTALSPTPRSRFTPSTRKGYYSLDVVSDFTVPTTKSITFCGAGRNLHVKQDPTKIFRRGFTAVERSRMIPNVEIWGGDSYPPGGWKSTLQINQRASILYRGYFRDSFGLGWSEDNGKADQTMYRVAAPRPNAPLNRQTVFQSALELNGNCVGFGDCPSTGWKSTYGLIFLDIENNYGIKNLQEQVNLYTYLVKTIKENASPQTLVGSIDPVAHNSFGYSRTSDYQAGVDEFLTMPVRHTASSRQRGLPDNLIGKTYSDYADFLMPGTYYLYPELDYSAQHNSDGDRHWLAALLGEQEVNMKLSPKKRIAWHWLFNTQNAEFPGSAKAEHPTPPAVSEGMGIFYWFTGAYGVLFWDDHTDLIPDQPAPSDPSQTGLGNDRNYACYEHYVHGLWRLFKHHSDLFNGRETYLNETTECSYDGGRTWYKYNANQLKTRNLPFVRAIVNGNQILIAATKAYARPDQTSQVMVRYVDNGYRFYTTLTLKGDEIYLGRAAMPRG